MSKIPTEFEAEELIFVLREHTGCQMPKRLLCRELDVDRRYFDKLLKIARSILDRSNELIMNDGSDNFYITKRRKVNGRRD